MAKVTPTVIQGAYASTAELNANFSALAAEFENCVSLDGTTPSAMLADFDMNGHDILNVGSITINGVTQGDAQFVTIQDTGGHFDATEVETALEEVKLLTDANAVDIATNTGGIATNATGIATNAAGVAANLAALAGAPVQTVAGQSQAGYSELIGTVPWDDTLPQVATEGWLLVSALITPTEADSVIRIFGELNVSCKTAGVHGTIFIGVDSAGSAIYAKEEYFPTAQIMHTIGVEFWVNAVDTTARTYNIGFGPNSGNFYINQTSAGRKYGGVMTNWCKATEYRANP